MGWAGRPETLRPWEKCFFLDSFYRTYQELTRFPNVRYAYQMGTSPDQAEVASRFASVAQRFCGVVDSAPNLERTELLVQVYRILPQLISEAVTLPPMELDDTQTPEDEKRESLARANVGSRYPQWSQLYELLKEKLGDWDLYWEVFDPRKDNQAIHGSLADDIADIYRDLKEGLVLGETQEASPGDNVWHWRLGFFSHWGKHAIDALRTIHFRLEGILG